MSTLRHLWAVVWKDVVIELRNKETVSTMTVFALIVLLVFSFGFDLRLTSDQNQAVAPGVLWVTIIFAGMLGLGRSFAREQDHGGLDGLLLCPVDRGVLYLGKMLGNGLFISVVEVVAVPLWIVFFNLRLPPALPLIVVLGTAGFAATGTLFSALAAHTRAREVMLPVLLLPLLVPLLIAAVKATGGLLDGQTLGELSPWPQVMIGYDVLMLAVSTMLFDVVVEQ